MTKIEEAKEELSKALEGLRDATSKTTSEADTEKSLQTVLDATRSIRRCTETVENGIAIHEAANEALKERATRAYAAFLNGCEECNPGLTEREWCFPAMQTVNDNILKGTDFKMYRVEETRTFKVFDDQGKCVGEFPSIPAKQGITIATKKDLEKANLKPVADTRSLVMYAEYSNDKKLTEEDMIVIAKATGAPDNVSGEDQLLDHLYRLGCIHKCTCKKSKCKATKVNLEAEYHKLARRMWSVEPPEK